MSYARRVAYNTIIQVLGRVLTTVTALILVSILNSGLRAEGWGSYVIVTTYLGFFAVVADLGINVLYLREISRYPQKLEELTARFLGFRLVSGVVVLGLAPVLASLVPVYAGFTRAILILSLGQLLLIFNQMLVSVFQARLVMDRAALGDLVGRVLILVLVIAIFGSGSGPDRLYPVLWANVIGNGLNLLVSYLFVRPYLAPRFSFEWRSYPALLAQVLPLSALTVLGLIHFKADSVIMTLYRPAVEVGTYGNAYKVVEVLVTLPGMFTGSLFPELNQRLLQKGADVASLIQKAFDLLLFAVLPIILLVAGFAPLIIGFLTRVNIWPAALSLQILSLAMLPWFIGVLMANVLLAADQQKALGRVELLAVVLNISLNLWLIPRYSYYGAASTTVITELLTTTLASWLVWKHLRFRPSLRSFQVVLPWLLMFVAAFVWLWHGPLLVSLWHYYFGLRHGAQALLSLGLGTGLLLVYLGPLYLLKAFPPVIQERLGRLRA